MSETKHAETDNFTLLSPEAFFDAISVDGDFVDYEGKRIKVRAMTGFEIFKTIKRIPRFRAFFVDVTTAFFGESESEATAALAKVNSRSIAELIADAGDDAIAAAIACFVDRPGDLPFEQSIMRGKKDGAIAAILAKGVELTLGGKSAEDFFIEKLGLLETMGIRKGEPKKPKRPTPTSANRTPGKSRKAA